MTNSERAAAAAELKATGQCNCTQAVLKVFEDRLPVDSDTLMKLTGRTPRKGETPLRFARRMDKQRAFAVPVTPLWRMMALSNYSRLEPTEKLAGQARDIFNALYKPQGLWVKLRFMLAAGFGKNCYRSLDTELVHQEPESPFGKYKDSLKQAAQAPKKNKQK